MHRFRDKEQPRGPAVNVHRSKDIRETPYLGQDLPLNWPPPLNSSAVDTQPSTAPPLPGHLNADVSNLNYYVLPDERVNVSSNEVSHNGGGVIEKKNKATDNKVNLRFGMTASDVIAYENQQVNPFASHHIPAHHYPKPDGTHNTTLLTEEFLLNQPPRDEGASRKSKENEKSTSGTDEQLAEAINISSWKNSMDLYPSTNSQRLSVMKCFCEINVFKIY